MTAEQAQHSVETLIQVYEQPSLQVTMAEIIQFWPTIDPALSGGPQVCPAPGVCDGIPRPKVNMSTLAPKPDCNIPSGCFSCSHHRDIDSEDYVWAIASMKHLQTMILHGFLSCEKNKHDPARSVEYTINILVTKIKWFEVSNNLRKKWVEEALQKIDEGDFHPYWRYIIESSELI